MVLISRNKIIWFLKKVKLSLKKIILIAILLFISTFIEVYCAVGKFSNQISSGCLDCTFMEEAFLMSLLTSIFFTFLFFLISFIKNIYLKSTIQAIILIMLWFFWNHTVFVDRESSWSTYTHKEEFLYTFSNSILSILLLSALTVSILNYISKNHETK